MATALDLIDAVLPQDAADATLMGRLHDSGWARAWSRSAATPWWTSPPAPRPPPTCWTATTPSPWCYGLRDLMLDLMRDLARRNLL